MRKRLIGLLISLLLVIIVIPTNANAATTVESGTCGANGSNLTWTLDSDGVLTISGSGKMEDHPSWNNSKSAIKTVVINSGVTSIGYCAFSGCSSLASITIPGSVTSIGSFAFSDCSSLTDVHIKDMDAWCRISFENASANPMGFDKNIDLNGNPIVSVTVPADVTKLEYTFNGFKDLISISLPDSLTSIGECAFSSCSSLVSINIPDSLTSIGYRAFYNCSSIMNIDIPGGVTSIGYGAFCYCSSLASVNIPDGVTSIGDQAFLGCSGLANIDIPDGVTSIGDQAFYNCSSLTSVNIPDGVTSIGEYAFNRCSSLASINIPDGVTSIGEGAFIGCNLKQVHITDLAAWCKISFGNTYANPLYYAHNLYLNGVLVESLEIPSGVQVIKSGTFSNTTCIKYVSLPESIVGVAANAFSGCSSITKVFYAGDETSKPAISAGNDYLTNAQWFYHSTASDYYCRISVQVSAGGRVTVDHGVCQEGDTITVTAAPYAEYELVSIKVDGAAISGSTFKAAGNHTVSAEFRLKPVVGGTQNYRLDSITLSSYDGEALQDIPTGKALATFSVTRLQGESDVTIMLCAYSANGQYHGLMWLTLKNLSVNATAEATLPIDNTDGKISYLRAFVVESRLSYMPIGNAITFGA